MRRILSGMQPTRQLHLGNYLGALRNWVGLQQEYECFFCIVDLHALTSVQEPSVLQQNTREVAAAYMAAGIDIERSHIFVQSHLLEHCFLSWILSCHTPLGWLERMTQFKDKAGKKGENAVLGLFSYPVLMSADILLYKATHVPVGEDQKQHLELCRDIASSFNGHYGMDYFVLPEPLIFGLGTRVMSLRDGTKKMSKSDTSDYSRINMTDDRDQIVRKIRKAKTDAYVLPEGEEGLSDRPEAKNLLTIYGALAQMSRQEVVESFAGEPFSLLKTRLSDLLVEQIVPITERMKELLSDPAEIDRLLQRGSARAREVAAYHVKEVKEIIGLV